MVLDEFIINLLKCRGWRQTSLMKWNDLCLVLHQKGSQTTTYNFQFRVHCARALLNLVKSWISTLKRLIKWIIYHIKSLKCTNKRKIILHFIVILFLLCPVGRLNKMYSLEIILKLKQINKVIYFIKFTEYYIRYIGNIAMTLSKYHFICICR